MPDFTGIMIGRYRLHEQLGKGGMAVIYKAFDTELERFVAIKIIRKEAFPIGFHEQLLTSFKQEARSLSSLSHPNIVNIYDYGDHQGDPFLVLEYLPKGTLAGIKKALPYAESFRLILPVAYALGYAHKNDFLHRDIKPSNILIGSEGQTVLSDFGISKLVGSLDRSGLTLTGALVGTPEYMSPEQGLGAVVDARSDIYALGIVLYELITGCRPFTADTPYAVVIKHVNDPLPDPRQFVPDLPLQVIHVLRRMLAKSPEVRYRSAADLIDAMLNCLAETAQVVAMPQIDLETIQVPLEGTSRLTSPTVPEEPPPIASQPNIIPPRRNRWLFLALRLVLAGLLIALTVTGIFLVRRDADRVSTAADINVPPTTIHLKAAFVSKTPTLTVSPQPSLTFTALTPAMTVSPQPSLTFTALMPTKTPFPTETRALTATPVPLVISRPTMNESNTLTNLWSLFPYRNPTKPVTLRYQAAVEPGKSYRWGAVWCAVDAETLVEILAPLTMELWVNGEKLSEEQIEIITSSRCRRWVTKLSDWIPGSLSTLELRYFLSKTIFDGEEYTEGGNYRLIIDVSVGQ
jgi:serine/threonine protein kinase